MTVQISGDFLPTQKITFERDGRQMSWDAPGRGDLVEQNGLWTYTTAPLEGELYSYTLYVDGQKMMDPSNIYQNRDIATWTNIFTISAEQGDKGWYYQVNDTPHGNVSKVWYDSPALGTQRRMTVTPLPAMKRTQRPSILSFTFSTDQAEMRMHGRTSAELYRSSTTSLLKEKLSQ